MKQASKEPLVSIIIPVYNVEPYLARCLDSVILQTYKNLEIIVVDDGSTDNSGKICDEYADKDKRIKVIHKKNGGLSDARNKGIEITNGIYIAFADSDDWLDLALIEKLVNAAQITNADITTCNIVRAKTPASAKTTKQNNQIKVYKKDEYLLKFFKIKGNETLYYAWNKLYKKELLTNKQYPYGLTCEDILGTYRALKKANIIAEIKDANYYYYINPNGITGSKFSKKDFDLLKVWDQMISESRPEDLDYIIYNRKRIDYTLLTRMALAFNFKEINSKFKDEKNNCEKNLKDSYESIKKYKMPISRRITMWLIVNNYKFFVFLLTGIRRIKND